MHGQATRFAHAAVHNEIRRANRAVVRMDVNGGVLGERTLLPRGVRGVSTARDHSRGPGIIEVISKSPSRRSPVTVTHLPVTRCQICHRTVAYRPGKASEVLTEHYRRAHPEALERPSR